ncbi:basic form of pathogenesis-related protein 1-like [Vigna unguiculata]|uniref:Pathogenesis-related protein 1 n=1 Tax=Vigna unguiculata TaxID=3917 RepID=A0A4D6L6W8_VIGUN|nr:basic form of pathogenesis-related protein 1-like [Vigna unguiculata]QCD84233.1 pathogenesis-related protein 1 [Vigna unguiculata]
MKTSNLVFILTIISMCSICLAQNSPQDFLDEHNKARKEVGVKPLVWDETLVAYGKNYVESKKKTCAFEHSNGPYGENLAQGSGDLSGVDSVKTWVAEKEFYDEKTNECVKEECLHYVQVVWGDTESVGCSRTKCDNNWMYVICNYNPPGNYVGVRPYPISK